MGGWGGGVQPVDLNWGVDGRSGECLRDQQEAYPPPWSTFGCSGVGIPRRWAGTALCPPGRGLCRHPRQLLPLRQFLYASLLAYGPIPPHPPFWHQSVRTTRAFPTEERDMRTGPVFSRRSLPLIGPGVCPRRCSVISGRASVLHRLSTRPHKLSGVVTNFWPNFHIQRVGARESWTRGWCNVGPPLALGLRGTTCPRPVCGPLGPSGGLVPLRFLWGHAGAGGHWSSSGHVPVATPTPGPPRYGPNFR